MKSILQCFRFVVLVVIFIAKVLDGHSAIVTANATGNWSGSAWAMTARSGTISTSTANATVSGLGTSFTTQVNVGNIFRTPAGVAIGTVLTVNSNTSITLTANSASSNSGIVCNVSGILVGDAAVIPGGFTVTVDKASQSCTTLGIGIGGAGNSILSFSSGTQLTVAGTVTIGSSGHTGSISMTSGGILTSKGFTITNAGTWTKGTGTIELNSTNTLPNTFFAGAFNNLTISLGTTTTSGSLTIGGNLNIPDGGGGGSILTTGFSMSVAGTTTVGGQPSGSASLIFTSANSATMINLVTIGTGGRWDNSIGNSPVTFQGGISSSGNFDAGTGMQTFNTNNQTLSGTLSLSSVTVNGVTLTNNSVLTITTALAGSGTLVQGTNATLNVNFNGLPGITGMTATATGNLVNYGAAGTQTLFPIDYYYLTLSNSGIKTLQTGTTNIAADFNITGTASSTGVADLPVGGNITTTVNAAFNTGAFTNTISGNVNNSGTFTASTGSTLNVSGDVNNISTGTFTTSPLTNTISGNINNSGTITAPTGSTLNVGGDVNNNSTGTFNTSPFTNTISGSINNSGIITAPAGSIVNVGGDLNNNSTGTFTTGSTSVTSITANVLNSGIFNGGIASFVNIGGNAENTSTGILNAGTNTIVFNGSLLQTITNNGAGAVNNITVNNTFGGLQLESPLTIPNVLDMTQGNIDLNGNNLIIGTDPTQKGTLAYTSGTIIGTSGSVKRFFDNSVIADGDQAGLYPVGTLTDFHPFSVSTPTGPAGGGSITLTYTDVAGTTAVSIPDGTSTINTLDNLNWGLTIGDGLNGGSYNLGVEGTGYGTVTDVNDLRISLAGSVVGTAGTNGGTTTDPQVNRTGLTDAQLTNTFFFGFSSTTPLPITLVYFKAYPVNEEVKLDWETSAEINNDHFTILRSTNSSVWETVIQIPGSGNTSINAFYTTLDQHPLKGISYYKLQQTDVDGHFSYSKIVSVNLGQTTNIAVYPNPATSLVFISTPDSGKMEFQLFNNAGQMIFIPSDRSPNNIRLNISSLPMGSYQLQTLYQGIKQTQTIIKN